MFEPFLKSFFVRTSDPTHIKLLKLEILTNLATETSISFILREFQTYISNTDKEFVAATIQAIGRWAIQRHDMRTVERAQYWTYQHRNVVVDLGLTEGAKLLIKETLYNGLIINCLILSFWDISQVMCVSFQQPTSYSLRLACCPILQP